MSSMMAKTVRVLILIVLVALVAVVQVDAGPGAYTLCYCGCLLVFSRVFRPFQDWSQMIVTWRGLHSSADLLKNRKCVSRESFQVLIFNVRISSSFAA